MAYGFETAINEMLAELGKQQEAMTRLHTGMKSITGSAVSVKRQLSVSVDARGKVTEMKFLNQSYRTMSATELASLIVSTIDEAQRDAHDRVAGHIGVSGMAGLDVRAALDGDIDWQAAFRHLAETQQPLLDLMAHARPNSGQELDDTGGRGTA